MRRPLQYGLAATIVFGIICLNTLFAADTASAPAFPQIPGVTAPDQRPNACVDCHREYPDTKADYRLTTVLKHWETAVDPKYFAKGKAAAPAGVPLTGKHPDVREGVKTIPTDCLQCHRSDSTTVPPFSRLLHLIHLENSRENHFLANYGGQCTHCHKLDPETGHWGLGSGTAVW
ncbi:MAG TPA: hypothetical protein PLP29_14520 [Candidatus Ozemobacteraceae bacterium]|nr:hypothetical protein [Candidatus Ozemobacteraceae bacterium]